MFIKTINYFFYKNIVKYKKKWKIKVLVLFQKLLWIKWKCVNKVKKLKLVYLQVFLYKCLMLFGLIYLVGHSLFINTEYVFLSVVPVVIYSVLH